MTDLPPIQPDAGEDEENKLRDPVKFARHMERARELLAEIKQEIEKTKQQ